MHHGELSAMGKHNHRERAAGEFPEKLYNQYRNLPCAARRLLSPMGVSSQSPTVVPSLYSNIRTKTSFSFARRKGKFKQNSLGIPTSTEPLELLGSFSASWRVSGTGLFSAKNQPLWPSSRSRSMARSPASQDMQDCCLCSSHAQSP